MVSQKLLKAFASTLKVDLGHAHCDYPCGIYDPHLAQIAALTTIRMTDAINKLESDHEKHDAAFRNNMMRAIQIKEQHAELAKREIGVIWGDYFKGEVKAKYPELDSLVHEILERGSKVRQGVDRDAAVALLEKINRFAELFWDSKGIATHRAKAPYKFEEEVVYPTI
jgi:nickel superoxide dismutase